MSKEYVPYTDDDVLDMLESVLPVDHQIAVTGSMESYDLAIARTIESAVASRCRAQGGITSDNTTQAAANKAAEEGGRGLPPLPEMNLIVTEKPGLRFESRGYTNKQMHDYARQAIAADRASRQVANKAEVASVSTLDSLPDLMDEWVDAARGADALAVYAKIESLLDQHVARQVAAQAGQVAVPEQTLTKEGVLPSYNSADYLKSPEALSAFLEDFKDESDNTVLQSAVGIVLVALKNIDQAFRHVSSAVAVPIYQIQYVDEKGSSVWHDVTEDSYRAFVLARRRIVYAAPSPAKESK